MANHKVVKSRNRVARGSRIESGKLRDVRCMMRPGTELRGGSSKTLRDVVDRAAQLGEDEHGSCEGQGKSGWGQGAREESHIFLCRCRIESAPDDGRWHAALCQQHGLDTNTSYDHVAWVVLVWYAAGVSGYHYSLVAPRLAVPP